MSMPGKAVWVGGGNTSMPGKGGGGGGTTSMPGKGGGGENYVNAR